MTLLYLRAIETAEGVGRHVKPKSFKKTASGCDLSSVASSPVRRTLCHWSSVSLQVRFGLPGPSGANIRLPLLRTSFSGQNLVLFPEQGHEVIPFSSPGSLFSFLVLLTLGEVREKVVKGQRRKPGRSPGAGTCGRRCAHRRLHAFDLATGPSFTNS